jgi:hypothetical protein
MIAITMMFKEVIVRQIYGIIPAGATKNRPSGGAVLGETGRN